MTRLAHSRIAGALFAGVLSFSVLFVSVANAAGLPLIARSGGIFVQGAERCTDVTLTAEPTGTVTAGKHNQVTIEGDLGSCTSGNVSIYSAASPHTVLFSAPVSLSGGKLVANGSAFTAPESAAGKVVLGLNGWLVPATWSYTAPEPEVEEPVYAGTPETGLVDVDWDLILSGPSNQACFDVRVTSAASGATAWQVKLNLALPPFNRGTSGYQLNNASGGPNISWLLRMNVDAGSMTATITGTGAVATVSPGQEHLFEVCNWTLPDPIQYPDGYTVSHQQTTWTNTRACIATSVIGTGASNFYFGWTAIVDMGPAVARLAAAGNSLSQFAYADGAIPDQEWMLTRIHRPDLGPYVYEVRSKTAGSIRATQTRQFVTCAVKY